MSSVSTRHLVEMRSAVSRTTSWGKVYAMSTRRVGPFPVRIRDVGVVYDLATHDIDLIRWLCGPVPVDALGHRSPWWTDRMRI